MNAQFLHSSWRVNYRIFIKTNLRYSRTCSFFSFLFETGIILSSLCCCSSLVCKHLTNFLFGKWYVIIRESLKKNLSWSIAFFKFLDLGWAFDDIILDGINDLLNNFSDSGFHLKPFELLNNRAALSLAILFLVCLIKGHANKLIYKTLLNLFD